MCRLSLVAPTLTHKAGFHPTAVFGAMGAGGRRRRGAQARPPRQMVDALGIAGIDGRRHHRISRRGRLDQAAACRLGGAIGPARGAAWPRRLLRAAHRVRRRARPLPRLRPHHRGRLRRADRRFRHALGDRDAGLQALSVRDHDASLYRLRAAARRAASRPTTSPRWSARSARAPCTGCGSRSPPSSIPPTAMPENSRRPIASPPASCAAMSGLSDFTDAAVKDPAVLALAAKVRYAIDPDNPYPKNFTGHIRAMLRDGSGGRGAPALYARRRAGAADPRRHRGQVRAQRQATAAGATRARRRR